MIVKDSDAIARLSSPMNLINKMSAARNNTRQSAMSLFIKPSIESPQPQRVETAPTIFNPFSEKPKEAITDSSSPRLDDISDDHDAKIALGLAHDKAIKLLNASVDALSAKLDDVRADKLPSVIAAASKTVESIRRERNEQSKNSKDREVHYHFYTPQQKKLTDYEVIEVAQ